MEHNDPVIWTSLLNKTTGTSRYKGRGSWITFPSGSYLSKVDWVLLPRHYATRLMVHVLWGARGGVLALSWWSTLRPRCSVSKPGIHYSAGLSPAARQRGGDSSTGVTAQPSHSPARRGLPSVGEIMLMCQLFHGGWDIVTVEGAQWKGRHCE